MQSRRRLAAAVVASLLALAAIALTLWWLPARSRVGYYIPATRGVVTSAPELELFRVRPWPWSTQPPSVNVALRIAGQPDQTSYATFTPVSFFSARAVEVTAFTGSSTFRKSGRISKITVTWRGGSTRRNLHHLWAVRAQYSPQIAGFGPLVNTTALYAAWPLALILTGVPHSVLAVASANPTSGPFQAPRCASVRNAANQLDGSPGHLQQVLDSLSGAACRSMTGPQALVLAGRPPATTVMYVFQPILREVVQGRIVTVDSGALQFGSVIKPGAFNWWQFLRAPAPRSGA